MLLHDTFVGDVPDQQSFQLCFYLLFLILGQYIHSSVNRNDNDDDDDNNNNNKMVQVSVRRR